MGAVLKARAAVQAEFICLLFPPPPRESCPGLSFLWDPSLCCCEPWGFCVTCGMCLGEARGTAQADSLAWLPTTPHGRPALPLTVPSQEAASNVGVPPEDGLGFNTSSLASKGRGHFPAFLASSVYLWGTFQFYSVPWGPGHFTEKSVLSLTEATCRTRLLAKASFFSFV